MSELISIIIPVYNVEKYIDKCLETIVSQSYTNLEIILVDDGATDSSGCKCDEWANEDERIRVIHKENGGLSSARNAGLDVANGQYITFVDSDDIVDPNMCQVLYDCVVDNDADISIGEVEHIFDSTYCFSKENGVIEYDPETAIAEIWYQKSFLPSAWGKLYKANIFEGKRFTEKRLYEDVDLMHELFWNAGKIVYTKSKLYGYFHREGSITTQRFSKKDFDILIIAQKILEFARDKSNKIQKAAEAYAVTAALRIYLNAPKAEMFYDGMTQAKQMLKDYGRKVLKDIDIRRKTKYALYLYFYCRPLIKVVYKRVNRWK